MATKRKPKTKVIPAGQLHRTLHDYHHGMFTGKCIGCGRPREHKFHRRVR